MKEPVWLTRAIVETIHVNQIREHGGQYGIRDINLLESWELSLVTITMIKKLYNERSFK